MLHLGELLKVQLPDSCISFNPRNIPTDYIGAFCIKNLTTRGNCGLNHLTTIILIRY